MEDYTFCMCADPRCKSYGFPTGTYTVYPETAFRFAIKTLFGFSKASGAITIMIEKATGVVGGDSSSSVLGAAESTALDLIALTKSEKIQKASSGLSYISTGKAVIEGNSVLEYDTVTFSLMKQYGISTSFTSKTEAIDTMDLMNSYVFNQSSYFFTIIDGQNTLYEIDKKILNSKVPDDTIETLAKNYKTALIYKGLFIKFDDAVKKFKTLLNGYNDRNSQISADLEALFEK